jgi:hypothetical protein
MTEPAPIYIETTEELTAHLREEVSTGNVGNVLCLLEVAADMGGSELADQVYADIVRPGMQARWNAWMRDDPDVPALTRDEARMMAGMIVENMTFEEAERLLSNLREPPRLRSIKGEGRRSKSRQAPLLHSVEEP